MADLLQFPMFSQAKEDRLPQSPGPLERTDADARAAALDIRRSWIVEAPAGSGKTGLLIQRFLKLLAFGGVERPGEVLAITFTRKAASELRTRVLEQLSAAARNEPLAPTAEDYERITRGLALAVLERDRALGWQLLASPNELRIRTIDSFCSELAGSLPLLSGGIGRRTPVEDASAIYEQAAERAMRELGGADRVLEEAIRCVLLHRDAQIRDCVGLVASMLAGREQWGELVPLQAHEQTEEALNNVIKQRLEATLDRVICNGLSHAAQAIGPDLLDELAHFAARLSAEPGYNGTLSPLACCQGRPHSPGDTAEQLDHWLALMSLLLTREGGWRKSLNQKHLGFKVPKQDEPWLKDLISQLQDLDDREPGLREALCSLRCLPPARYPAEQWRVAKALFRVLRQAIAELDVLFAEQSLCDFTEIALTARRLLRAEPDLLSLPGAQITHLLVDEMQDTSAGQYDLLELLTRNWDGATQTLFLVGDPKQSIYAFRQARVERFLRTQSAEHLGDVPLGALRLTANFRSQAELVTEFNRTFEQILPAPGKLQHGRMDTGDVPYVEAIPARGPGQRPALVWHPRLKEREEPLLDDEDQPDEEAADPSAGSEALALRRTIEDFTANWHTRVFKTTGRPRAPRIAVLARSRAHLAPVIEEFHRDRGHGPLPFRAVDVEVLNERPEVLDLLALTRALLHPGDRIAWLAVLHSPVCGLGLADLLALTGEGPEADAEATVAHLVATRTPLLSAEAQRLLARTWPVLATAQGDAGRTAFSMQVERTWRSLGADALLRPEEKLNARRFLELLQELEAAAEPFHLATLERRLKKLYAEPFAAPDAVELMTIHKAKGLEWDLVLVPALERGTGKNQAGLLKWVELDEDREDGEPAQVILAPIQGKGEEASRLSKWVADLEKQRAAAETKRLFYVACTRAREALHLFAAVQFKADGNLALPAHDSLLRASWAAAEPEIARQVAGLRQVAEERDVAPALLAMAPTPFLIEPQQPLTLAAAAESPADPQNSEDPQEDAAFRPPLLERLPAGFDPLARFRPQAGPGLPYTPAASLRHAAPFARPEGSFAARAFGNAVHRFLDLMARRLAEGQSSSDLLAELPEWRNRLQTIFRAEGLAPGPSAREAERALTALDITLRDPIGHWLLCPHAEARSERALQLGSDAAAGPVRSLRADRSFIAGPAPLSPHKPDDPSVLWIVDFKTAEPGGRSREGFFAAEEGKYRPQLQAYAEAAMAAATNGQPIVLALFYPLLPHLLYWTYEPARASQ